jgi:hypothetical protein
MDAENGVPKLPLGNAAYLVFKLSADDRGRRVKNPSSGTCLAVVAEGWSRDEAVAGVPPIAPEPVSLSGYVAHFFDLSNKGSKIAFRDDKNQPVVIAPGGPRFQLVGNQIPDASENLGPLFAREPPRMSVADETWKNVGTIVLGEEGKGRGKWRMAFEPNPDQREQPMPQQLADRKAGWYFVRFYDPKDELIDSLDFRFCAGLRQVRIQPCQLFPSAAGHDAATVELELESEWQVVPSDATHGGVTVERNGDTTLLRIPPLPSCDLTRWKLRTDSGHQLEIAFLVERIWWAVSGQHNPPQEWTDRQVPLSREDLLATSNKALWVRLPRAGLYNEVHVGFDAVHARRYMVRTSEHMAVIPLRDFGDSPQMRNAGTHELRLRIVQESASVCQLRISLGCRFCDFIAGAIEEVLSHVRDRHLNELFPPLTYDEMRDFLPSLPVKIYKCAYCPSYVPADDPENPTSAVIHHIENCPYAARNHGMVQISFSVISDVDEIRQNVIANLPRIHRCRLCDEVFREAVDGQMWTHLFEEHKDTLFALR